MIVNSLVSRISRNSITESDMPSALGLVLNVFDYFATFGSEIEMAWNRVYMTSMAVR